MSKKSTTQTREGLIAALAALDNSTEIARLKAEVSRLTAEVSSLVSQRATLEKENRSAMETLSAIRGLLRGDDKRHRAYGPASHRHVALQEAAQRTAALASASVQLGVQNGTHDPETGLPYTKETKPQRDLSAGAPQVTKGELAAFFPALSGSEMAGIEE